MSVDQAIVRRIAQLARIAVSDEEVPHLEGELNAILSFVEELGAVDVTGRQFQYDYKTDTFVVTGELRELTDASH